MGTKIGPNYANVFVGFVEKQIFEPYTDDCFPTASSYRVELERFINFDNNIHPALQFTWEISKTSVSFLDILVLINGNTHVTYVFYKPSY
jgi:hypothetical protein